MITMQRAQAERPMHDERRVQMARGVRPLQTVKATLVPASAPPTQASAVNPRVRLLPLSSSLPPVPLPLSCHLVSWPPWPRRLGRGSSTQHRGAYRRSVSTASLPAAPVHPGVDQSASHVTRDTCHVTGFVSCMRRCQLRLSALLAALASAGTAEFERAARPDAGHPRAASKGSRAATA